VQTPVQVRNGAEAGCTMVAVVHAVTVEKADHNWPAEEVRNVEAAVAIAVELPQPEVPMALVVLRATTLFSADTALGTPVLVPD
jgi:hypothetical protein